MASGIFSEQGFERNTVRSLTHHITTLSYRLQGRGQRNIVFILVRIMDTVTRKNPVLRHDSSGGGNDKQLPLCDATTFCLNFSVTGGSIIQMGEKVSA